MMDFDEVINNAEQYEDSVCKLFEKENCEAVSAKFKYLLLFWNYIKYRINQENLEWETHFCYGSMNTLKELYLSNLDKWGEKTILFSIRKNFGDASTYEGYQILQRYTCKDYQEFWKCHSSDFPEMKRLISKWTEDFLQHIKEIIIRTVISYDELITEVFQCNPGKVESIKGGISDIHDGRCVHIMTFENGSKIVYKPRSLKLDLIWNNYLDFLTDKAGVMRFPTYRCVCGDNYGFAEFVESFPVEAETEFGEFYYNCGFLLGAVYYLQGSDLHSENLLACGKYPVLIDVETIVRSGNLSYVTDIFEKFEPYEKDNVRKTNLLPFVSVHKYLKPGGDAFASKHYHSNNLPYTIDGKEGNGRGFCKELLSGFILCYNTLIQYGKDLFVGEGVLKNLRDCDVRILLRNTSEYERYLTLLSNQENMKDRIYFKNTLTNLKKLYSTKSTEENLIPELSKFYLEEWISLNNGYIPTISIYLCDELPGNKEFHTAFDYLVNKHANLSTEDLTFQCSNIIKSLSENKADDGCNTIIIINKDELQAFDFQKQLNCFMENWMEKWETILTGKIPCGYFVDRETNLFYYTKLEFPFTECFLGLVPALSLWYKMTKKEKAFKLMEIIAKRIEEDFKLRSPSIYGEGLSDGLDGLCLIAKQAFEMTGSVSFQKIYRLSLEAIINKKVKRNCYSEAEVQSLYFSQTASLYVLAQCVNDSPRIIEKLEELAKIKLAQIKDGIEAEPFGLMKGMDGLFLALRLARPNLKAELAAEIDACINNYWNNLVPEKSLEIGYSVANGLAGHLLATKEEVIKEKSIFLPYVQNISFAYGNAGLIYTLDKLLETESSLEYRERSDRYASYLLKEICKKGFQFNQPSDDPLPSFQFGEGGVVYSLVHHLYVIKGRVF